MGGRGGVLGVQCGAGSPASWESGMGGAGILGVEGGGWLASPGVTPPPPHCMWPASLPDRASSRLAPAACLMPRTGLGGHPGSAAWSLALPVDQQEWAA